MSARSVAVDAYLLFGRLAVKYKHISPEELTRLVAAHEGAVAGGRSVTFGQVCLEDGALKKPQRDELLRMQEAADVKNEGTFFGYLSLVNGFVNKSQLALSLKEQSRKRKAGENPPRLGEIFVNHGLMNDRQVQAILSAQNRLRLRLTEGSAPITQTGRIPVLGNAAQEALARLAQFEAQMGAPVEVDLAESQATEMAEPEPVADILPAPPREFTRTYSRDDIEVHAADAVFDSNPAGAVPAQLAEAAEVAMGDDLASAGLGLGADDDDIQLVAPPAAPRKPAPTRRKPAPSSPGASRSDTSSNTGIFVAPGANAPEAAIAKPSSNTKVQPAKLVGRRGAAAVENEQFKPPSNSGYYLIVVVGVGLAVAAYVIANMLLS